MNRSYFVISATSAALLLAIGCSSSDLTSPAPGSDGGITQDAAATDAATTDAAVTDAAATDASDEDAGNSCSSSSQCSGDDFECVAQGEPQCGGVMQRITLPCSSDADCADAGSSSACQLVNCATAPDGGSVRQCAPPCTSDSDCLDTQSCQTGHCAVPSCSTDTDCKANFACASDSHTCQRKTCTTDSQCAGHCVNSSCFPRGGVCSPLPV